MCHAPLAFASKESDMAKCIVTIEGFNDCKVVEFEADTPEDAEKIGRDIFYEECNYGVSPATED